MLQPMQPIGQQKPGMNMPQGQRPAPGQQTMPAGAAFQRGILPGGIASNPEDIKAAYGGTPQGQQKLDQAQKQGDYLSAIALAQILEEEREKAAQKANQFMESGKPAPVLDRMREEAVELRRQDLEEQQAKRLGMEQQRSQAGMAQMLQQAARPQMQGIAQLPAQNVAQPQAMAAGGIVAFDNGGEVVEKVFEEVVRPVGANPYAGLTNKQIVEKFGREQLGTDRREAERRAREDYMKFAGFTPEERARQEKRIADMEEYDKREYSPERMQSDRLFRSLSAARGMSGAEALGNYGLASSFYQDKQRELVRQRMEDRQKKAQAWDEAQRGARVKGYEAGTTEGKEVLAGQRQGIAGLGEVLQADSRIATAGAGMDNKIQQRAAQEVASDEYINILKSELTDMRKLNQQSTPEYRAKLREIFDREAAIYKKYPGAIQPTPPALNEPKELPKEEGNWFFDLFSGDKQKERGQQLNQQLGLGNVAQSGQSQKDTPIQAPADKSKMIVGQMYNTKRGPARWNGTAYEQ